MEKPAGKFTNPGTVTSVQSKQNLGDGKEKKEEAPRAGTSRPAGPGPETKVTNQSNIDPTLTDDEKLHVHGQTRFNDDPGNDADLADGGDHHEDANPDQDEDQEPDYCLRAGVINPDYRGEASNGEGTGRSRNNRKDELVP